MGVAIEVSELINTRKKLEEVRPLQNTEFCPPEQSKGSLHS